MAHRIIEINDPLASISLNRGFMRVKVEGSQKAQIPLADIEVLILNGTGLSLTTNLLNALLENGVMIVILGKNYLPSGIFYPTNPHHLHRQKINLQISASKPLNKRLWQAIVKAKISNQAAILSFFTKEEEKKMLEMAKRVSSGDTENIEAQAAKIYWRRLFGEDFRRNFAGSDVNSALNYGYAIIRSSLARSVFASGLHPAFGIFHSNQENSFCLVDDLIEPFRPIVDFVVKRLVEINDIKADQPLELDSEIKRNLVKILEISLATSSGNMSLANCGLRLAQSLVRSLENQEMLLDFPSSPLPIDLEIF